MSINAYIYLYTSKKLLNWFRQQYDPFVRLPTSLEHQQGQVTMPRSTPITASWYIRLQHCAPPDSALGKTPEMRNQTWGFRNRVLPALQVHDTDTCPKSLHFTNIMEVLGTPGINSNIVCLIISAVLCSALFIWHARPVTCIFRELILCVCV